MSKIFIHTIIYILCHSGQKRREEWKIKCTKVPFNRFIHCSFFWCDPPWSLGYDELKAIVVQNLDLTLTKH